MFILETVALLALTGAFCGGLFLLHAMNCVRDLICDGALVRRVECEFERHACIGSLCAVDVCVNNTTRCAHWHTCSIRELESEPEQSMPCER